MQSIIATIYKSNCTEQSDQQTCHHIQIPSEQLNNLTTQKNEGKNYIILLRQEINYKYISICSLNTVLFAVRLTANKAYFLLSEIKNIGKIFQKLYQFAELFSNYFEEGSLFEIM